MRQETAKTPGERRSGAGDPQLFLTDDQLRQSAEMMYFAYRAFTADPDEILTARGFGRAHHRVLHFIGARRSLTVGDLMDILGITKQSLNRVLRALIEKGLVEQRRGEKDQRQRLLSLTSEGVALERQLTETQRERLKRAFLDAGVEAVQGFREVLERMLDAEDRPRLMRFVAGDAETEPQDRRGTDRGDEARFATERDKAIGGSAWL